MHCIVIEWGDGTVTVNGPYPDELAAINGARRLIPDVAEQSGLRVESQPEYPGETAWVLGEDGEDQVYVYWQEMGTPIVESPVSEATDADDVPQPDEEA